LFYKKIEATMQQLQPSALNDAPLFERSASLERLDFFASFFCQEKKEVPAAQASYGTISGCDN
jgi:hypothetical protein